MNMRIVRLLFGTLIGLALCGAILVLPQPASSAPNTRYHINVTTTADEYNIGVDTNCSLREAVKAANGSADFGGCVLEFSSISFGPTTILLPSGIYTLTRTGANEDLDATGDLDLRQSVIISATGASLPIVTGDVGWTDRIFHIISGTATIDGLTIRRGTGFPNEGGGVLIETDAGVSLNNVILSSNSASFAGGGLFNHGTAMLTNVTISGNSTGNNGG